MKTLLAVVIAVALSAAPDKSSKKPGPPSQTTEITLTGCVDQRGERYVLKSATDMTVVTRLKGKGFSDDNFARYIGQKVTVSGSSREGLMEVTKITKLADTCSE